MLVEVAGAVVVVVAFIAGLEAVVGAFGAADGVWATAKEALAARTIAELSKVLDLMVAGIVLREASRRQASHARKCAAFLLLQQS